jgi:peptidoglycan/LPS O-acetylase OafA/YrhL
MNSGITGVPFGRGESLTQVMNRDNNNLDLFRLIAALAVIYGHSFALAPSPGFDDVLFRLSGQNTAAMAVKFFFFLSGLLVTDSLLTRKSLLQFFVARFFRIWPGLTFVVLVSIFIIGPLATKLDLASYFSDPKTYLYFKHQILMQTWGTQSLGYFDLPGVFTENAYKNTVNASQWSLFPEVFAYLTLAAVFSVGLLEKRLGTLLILFILVDAVAPSRIIFTSLPMGNEDFSYLPFCFAAGAFFAIHKESIVIDARLPIGFALLFVLFQFTPNARYFFFLLMFTLALYLGTRRWIIERLRLPFDVSYGTFLWGFPIQQMLATYLPNMTGIAHCLVAMTLAGLAGVASWKLVEQRSIYMGKQVAKALSRFQSLPT